MISHFNERIYFAPFQIIMDSVTGRKRQQVIFFE
jgi:hypothetical protein